MIFLTITLNYFVGTVNFGRPLARKDPQKKPCQKRRAIRSGDRDPEICLDLWGLAIGSRKSRYRQVSVRAAAPEPEWKSCLGDNHGSSHLTHERGAYLGDY